MSIYLRSDGNSKTGLGHLYRTIAIAEMLKDSFEFSFVTRRNSNLEIIPKEYNVLLIPDEVPILEESKWFSNNINTPNSVVIADGYQFNSQYQKNIKQAGFKLMYIDDLANEYMYADMVMNQSPGFSKNDYKAEPYTQFALGLDYVLLRQVFIKSAVSDVKPKDNYADRFFICFGGSDPLSYTNKTLETILSLLEVKIEVVIGAANKDEKKLLKIYGDYDRIHFHKSLSQSQMLEIMKRCSVAIVPSSGVLLEAAAAGCDIITCWYVQNQKKFHDVLVNQDVINSFGDNSKVFQKQSLENLIKLYKEEKGIVSSSGLKAQIKFSKKNIIAIVQALQK